MKNYKVNKNLNRQPYILGLRLPLFFLFVLSISLGIFTLIGSISLKKILLIGFFIFFVYLVLKKLNSGSLFDFVANEKFPKSITNDNFR